MGRPLESLQRLRKDSTPGEGRRRLGGWSAGDPGQSETLAGETPADQPAGGRRSSAGSEAHGPNDLTRSRGQNDAEF